MSSVNHINNCKNCGKEFECVIYQTTCVACLIEDLPLLKATYTHWQPEPCKHELKKTIVVHTTTTCETTVTVCAICNKWLDKPKTNC